MEWCTKGEADPIHESEVVDEVCLKIRFLSCSVITEREYKIPSIKKEQFRLLQKLLDNDVKTLVVHTHTHTHTHTSKFHRSVMVYVQLAFDV